MPQYKRIETSSPHQAVYSSSGGVAQVLTGLVVLAIAMFLAGPGLKVLIETHELSGVRLAFGIMLAIWGCKLIFIHPRVTLDKAVGTVTLSQCPVLGQRVATDRLAAFTEVTINRKVVKNRESSRTTFPIRLSGQQEREIELIAPSDRSEAVQQGREIADFLGLPLADHCENMDQAALRQVERGFRTFQRIGGGQTRPPIHRRDIQRLEYRDRFGGFMKLWGCVAFLVGTWVVIAVLMGIKPGTHDRHNQQDHYDSPYVGFLVGGAFACAGLVVLTGRRGKTFDQKRRTVSFWWGCLVPWHKTTHDLNAFQAVSIRREMNDWQGTLYATYPVCLVGPNDAQLKLFEPRIEQDGRVLGAEIAGFLNMEIVDSIADLSGSEDSKALR